MAPRSIGGSRARPQGRAGSRRGAGDCFGGASLRPGVAARRSRGAGRGAAIGGPAGRVGAIAAFAARRGPRSLGARRGAQARGRARCSRGGEPGRALHPRDGVPARCPGCAGHARCAATRAGPAGRSAGRGRGRACQVSGPGRVQPVLPRELPAPGARRVPAGNGRPRGRADSHRCSAKARLRDCRQGRRPRLSPELPRACPGEPAHARARPAVAHRACRDPVAGTRGDSDVSGWRMETSEVFVRLDRKRRVVRAFRLRAIRVALGSCGTGEMDSSLAVETATWR